MATAYIITKPADEGECRWCTFAAGFLVGHGFDVEVLPMPHAARQSYYKGSGTKTIPQIYIDGQHIGGYEDLVKWIEENKK